MIGNTTSCYVQEMAAKDLMAQHMYAKLLQWLINKINKVLKSDITGECKSITIVNMPDFGLSKVCDQFSV